MVSCGVSHCLEGPTIHNTLFIDLGLEWFSFGLGLPQIILEPSLLLVHLDLIREILLVQDLILSFLSFQVSVVRSVVVHLLNNGILVIRGTDRHVLDLDSSLLILF